MEKPGWFNGDEGLWTELEKADARTVRLGRISSFFKSEKTHGKAINLGLMTGIGTTVAALGSVWSATAAAAAFVWGAPVSGVVSFLGGLAAGGATLTAGIAVTFFGPALAIGLFLGAAGAIFDENLLKKRISRLGEREIRDLLAVCVAARDKMSPGNNCTAVEEGLAIRIGGAAQEAIVDLEKKKYAEFAASPDGLRQKQEEENRRLQEEERKRQVAELARRELASSVMKAVPEAFSPATRDGDASTLAALSSLGTLGTDGVMVFGMAAAMIPTVRDAVAVLELQKITGSNIPKLLDAYLAVPEEERKSVHNDFGTSPEEDLRDGLASALSRVMTIRRAEIERLKAAVAIEARVLAHETEVPSVEPSAVEDAGRMQPAVKHLRGNRTRRTMTSGMSY